MAKLFFDTFVNQHVRVNGHTHCKDDTGNSRQCQRGVELREDTEDKEYIEQQGEVGNPSSLGVIRHHEDDNKRKSGSH